MNIIFIHSHTLSVATAKKMEFNLYSIDGYMDVEQYKELKIPIYGIYLSIYCKKCQKYLLKTKYFQEFLFFPNEIIKLNNAFNEEGKLERVFYEDNPQQNLIKNNKLISCKFYRINTTPIYDSNNIYIGTSEEQKEYFHKKFIEFKQKTYTQKQNLKITKKN